MDHKQRRGPIPVKPGPTPETGALFAAAVEHHAAGRLADAEQLYRRVLAIDPRHADSLHRIGVMAYQLGQLEVAAGYLHKAVELDRSVAAYYNHLGLVLAGQGRLEEAARAAQDAATLAPAAVDIQVNLGLILMQLGRFEAAAVNCRRAVELAPELPDAHANLGAVLHELGRSGEAADCYRRALQLEPDYPEAQTGLGNVLLDLGAPEEAMAHHRRAIELRPGFAAAHYNLGQALRHFGRLDEAAGQFGAAIAAEPGMAVAHTNLAAILRTSGDLAGAKAILRAALGATSDQHQVLNDLASTLLAQGQPGEALRTVARALEIRETAGARATFVECVANLDIGASAMGLRPLLLRALRESWARPEGLARVGLALVRQDPAIAASLARAADAWPGPLTGTALYGDAGVTAIAGDELLQTLLCVAPNTDFGFERLLTLARQGLLGDAGGGRIPEDALAFYSALARQCFLNEYVFRSTEDEERRAVALHERLAAELARGEGASPALVLAVACYFPLSSVPLAEQLLERRWPVAVEAVLKQQVVEVREEAELRDAIPRLTPIHDGGSLKVRAQYEESPYPRWLDAGAGEPPQRLVDYLVGKFPLAGLEPPSAWPAPDILIAGCGTGWNALDTARAFKGARTLAIDLSVASLAHAVRKTCEAGVADVVYAQADLLQVASLGRDFDVIEAVGVLHHIVDPLAGWRKLLAVLRPGGVMKLGFYSAVARRNLPRLDIGEPTPDAIRDARQVLAGRNDEQAAEGDALG